MAGERGRRDARGDEAELFEAYHEQLLRGVAASVDAPRELIEDACVFAWAQFLEHQPDRDRNWRGWLFRVAQREAWALNRAAGDHATLCAREVAGEPRPAI